MFFGPGLQVFPLSGIAWRAAWAFEVADDWEVFFGDAPSAVPVEPLGFGGNGAKRCAVHFGDARGDAGPVAICLIGWPWEITVVFARAEVVGVRGVGDIDVWRDRRAVGDFPVDRRGTAGTRLAPMARINREIGNASIVETKCYVLPIA